MLPRIKLDHSADIADTENEIRSLEQSIEVARAAFRAKGIEDAANLIADLSLELSAKLLELDELYRSEPDPDPENMFSNEYAAEIWDGILPERKREIIEEVCQVWVGPVSYRSKSSGQNAIPPDEDNVEVKFRRKDGTFPDRPVNKSYVTDTDIVREVLREMFSEQDAWPIREVTVAGKRSGHYRGIRVVQNVRREMGLITSGSVWAKPGASMEGMPVRESRLPDLPPRICERDGCGKEFQPYRRFQFSCSGECRDAGYMATHPNAHGKRS